MLKKNGWRISSRLRRERMILFRERNKHNNSKCAVSRSPHRLNDEPPSG